MDTKRRGYQKPKTPHKSTQSMHISRGPLADLLDRNNPAAQQLLTQGWAIVRVCSTERAAELRDLFWTDLENLGTGIDRSKSTTWNTDNLPQHTHGLFQNKKMGLRQGVCVARLETEHVWRALFNGLDCLSSFDAVSWSSPAMQEREYKKELSQQEKEKDNVLLSSWCHTDQAKSKPDCAIHYQGAFALTSLGLAEKRTQLVVPPVGITLQDFSDTFLDAYPNIPCEKGKFDPKRAEWVKHTQPERKWLIEHGCVFAPIVEAGCMLLWDSRIPHASIPGPTTVDRNLRMSIFVSARPCILISKSDVVVRRSMLSKTLTSGHRVTSIDKRKRKYLACKFNDTGRTYGKKLKTFNMDGIVSNFDDAFKSGDPNSIVYRTAVFCGAYGRDHLLRSSNTV